MRLSWLCVCTHFIFYATLVERSKHRKKKKKIWADYKTFSRIFLKLASYTPRRVGWIFQFFLKSNFHLHRDHFFRFIYIFCTFLKIFLIMISLKFMNTSTTLCVFHSLSLPLVVLRKIIFLLRVGFVCSAFIPLRALA